MGLNKKIKNINRTYSHTYHKKQHSCKRVNVFLLLVNDKMHIERIDSFALVKNR